MAWRVVRTMTGEHCGEFDTAQEAMKEALAQKGMEERLVEIGWIQTPSTYCVEEAV